MIDHEDTMFQNSN